MLDFIKMTVSVLTSLAVCYITLSSANKRHRELSDKQQKNHQENMEISDKRHQEQLAISKENERLRHLPYLSIVPKHKNHRFEGDMVKEYDKNIISIPFEIINDGAGIAFSIKLKYIDGDIKPKGMDHIAAAIKKNIDDSYDILGVREPIHTDVLRIDKQTEFCLLLAAVDKDFNEIEPTSDILWELEITFCDIQGRAYSQTYSFFTSTRNHKILRINSNMPKLRK